MGYASDIIKTKEFKLLNPCTNKQILKDGEIINLENPKDTFFSKQDPGEVTKFLFGRSTINDKLVSYSDIRKWGWVLVEAPMIYIRWFPGQQVYFYLYDSNQPIKANHFPIQEVPTGHKIRFKIRERLIRLEGRNAGPYGYGRWKTLETKIAIKKPRRRRRLLQIMKTSQKKRLRREGRL